MNIPKKLENESLAMWRKRVADEFGLDYKMREILNVVSVEHYTEGVDVMLNTLKQEGRL